MPGLVRESNTERPWRETCGPTGTLRWGTGCGQRWKMVRRGGAQSSPRTRSWTCDGGVGAAPAPPSGQTRRFARGRIGIRRTVQRSTSPPAPRETRRGRGGYPTRRWWGCRPRGTGSRHLITAWGGEARRQRPTNDPTVGKPASAPASRSACGICGGRGAWEAASAPAAVQAAHARRTPEHQTHSGGLRGEACQRACIRCPVFDAASREQRSILRPPPATGRRFVPSWVRHRESSARSSWQSRVREVTPSILRCERWQSKQQTHSAAAGGPLATVPAPQQGDRFPGCAKRGPRATPHEKPRVSRRRSHRRRSTRLRSRWS